MNIDSGFGRTLIELLYRPGYMIGDYIAGKRIHYFRPFQTLFVLAAVYIMCVQLVDPAALKRQNNPKESRKEEIISAQKAIKKELKQADDSITQKQLTLTLQNLDRQLADLQNDTLPVHNIGANTSDADDFIDGFVEGTTELNNQVDSYFQHSPFLMKVWDLLKSWGHGNKAFRIICTLPLFALATLFAYRRKKYCTRYNLTEHVFIQAYIACQVLLLSILILPFNGTARVGDLYEVPYWLIFLLFFWDYKQLYRSSWWSSFWRTLLMFTYSLLLLVLFAIIIVGGLVAIVYLFKTM